jgi:subtilisin family serine protease
MPLGRFAALAALGATGPDIVPHGEVRVGMVDTELRHHPVLDGARVLPQPRPFLRRSNQIGDESSHSSDEALTFRASHATAIAGVVLQAAPGAEIDVQGTLVDQGWTTSWNAANAIASYAESGIDILNLSFSCYTRDGLPPLALTTAIDRLDPRIVVVAAAGNYGQYTSAYDLDLSKAPAWPAAIDSVIAVGAAEHGDDEKWRTAAFSPKAPWVDIVAQGTNVLSVIIARPEGPADGRNADALPEHPSFARWSGTSLATALVTGRIADWIVRHRVPAWVAWRQLAESLEVGLEDSVPDVYDPKILEP